MGDVKVEERAMDEDELAPVTKVRSLGALYYRTYVLAKSFSPASYAIDLPVNMETG